MGQNSPEKDMHEIVINAFVPADDITSFLSNDKKEVIGYSYEWEEEGVVHFYLSQKKHSFGSQSRCLFKKNKQCEIADFSTGISYVVTLNEGKTKGYYYTHNNIVEIPINFIPGKEDLYSRSKGLIEIDILAKKHVAIVGLGSFGSQIAIELAKAGVGEFSLFDFDKVELHNLGRHTCTINDLGRLKINAIEDAILGKNPYAKINKYPIDIIKESGLFLNIFPNIDLLICATDNNDSRFLISSALHKYKKVGIFGRAITRASGGDVFRYIPGGPCYSCLIGTKFINPKDEEISSEEAGRRSGAIPAYASANDVNAMVQVGLSVDIEPICNLMLKLSLLELSKGMDSGISSLDEDLKYDAYIWANRRDNNFKNWHPFFRSGSHQTILKWYGINIPKDEGCVICSDNPILDLGNVKPISNFDELSSLDIQL